MRLTTHLLLSSLLCLVSACAAVNEALLKASRSDTQREALVTQGGFDLQCPENVRVNVDVPARWYAQGVIVPANHEGPGRDGQIAYWTPEGSRITWCDYSRRVWDRQLAALKAWEEPTLEVSNPERRALIARWPQWVEEDEAEQARLLAAQEYEDQAPERERAAQQAEYAARVEAQRQTKAAEEIAERQRVIVAARLARKHFSLLASAHICSLRAQKASAQEDIERERRIAAVGGFVDKSSVYGASEDVVDLSDAIADAESAMRAQRARILPCNGKVMDYARCLVSDCPDGVFFPVPAFEAARSALNGEASLDAMESEAASSIGQEQLAEAARMTQEASALIAAP